MPIDQKKMGEMVDALYILQPDLHNHRCFLFLDEVQNVEGWPLVIWIQKTLKFMSPARRLSYLARKFQHPYVGGLYP
ncbi:unknown protein [Parachlamydia acanthamoebae UV-7]|uniref:AAA domain-containing protein n=2 Tax=Parachlamydia acanthamoebae TaxID=83552 RepID=F8KWI9_PARAV|nr:hypothetical protein [Parachlamydia acanthamoebae]CCB85388.1 unknown protein [Parachlamydia acanthamoebae UV-7]